jgi:group I intron endonuclease
MRISGVYSIISPTGNIYIGSSIDINRRFYMYKIMQCHKQKKLYNSLKKYGYDAHTFSIIKVCEPEDRYKYEREYGVLFNTVEDGLNCCLPSFGELPPISTKRTPEQIEKMRQINIGRKVSDATREKHRIAAYKRKQTEETKEKVRQIRLGTKRSDETKRRISEAGKGKISKKRRAIICNFISTGESKEYSHIAEAAKDLGILESSVKNNLYGLSKFTNTKFGKAKLVHK